MREKPATPFLGTNAIEGWIIFGVMILVSTLIGVSFPGEDRGWIAGDATGALGCLIALAWPLHRERWFWATMGAFFALNVFAVFCLDWSFTHNWHGREISLLGIADLAAMTAITYGLYCLIYGRPSKAIAALPDEGRAYSDRDLDL